jgi:hypothetical protein
MRVNSVDSPDGTTAYEARARRIDVDSYSSAQVAEAMVLPPPRVPMYFASDSILPCRSVRNRLAPEDLCGLTLLIFSHVNLMAPSSSTCTLASRWRPKRPLRSR